MVNAKLIAVVLVAGVGISTFVALSTTYHSNSEAFSADSTVGDVCAEMAPEQMTGEIEKLCKDANDILLSEETGCGTPGSDPVAYFTFGEIITAEDAGAAFNAVAERCTSEGRRLGDRKKYDFGRKLWTMPSTDYGWCSTAIGFLVGGADTSNYCDPSQSCDSSGGCGGSLSNCCIVHDKCLQSGVPGTSRCDKGNCKGAWCDAELSSCAWDVSCWYKCGWASCYDFGCGVASTAVWGVMGLGSSSPQAGWNTGGKNCN